MKRAILCLTMVFCLSLLPLMATQTDNYGLHAVPAPGKVLIDGELSDWDRSGEVIFCYDMETLPERFSGRVSLMYDAENLQVAIRWKDEVPMGNIHDPRFQADNGWAGDSVQSHITAWYHADGKEPAMLIDYGVGLAKPFGGWNKKLLRTEGATFGFPLFTNNL